MGRVYFRVRVTVYVRVFVEYVFCFVYDVFYLFDERFSFGL